MSISKTQIFLFFESGNYVKATRRLPQASSLSCLHRFIIIFINGAICIRIRLCRFLCLLLFLDFLEYEECTGDLAHKDSLHIPTWISVAKRLSSSNYFYPDGSPFSYTIFHTSEWKNKSGKWVAKSYFAWMKSFCFFNFGCKFPPKIQKKQQ